MISTLRIGTTTLAALLLLTATAPPAAADNAIVDVLSGALPSECPKDMEPIDWVICYLEAEEVVEKVEYEVDLHANKALATITYVDAQTKELTTRSIAIVWNEQAITIVFATATLTNERNLEAVVVKTGADSVAYARAAGEEECRFYANMSVCNISLTLESGAGNDGIGDAASHCDPDGGIVLYLACIAVETAKLVAAHYQEAAADANAFVANESQDLDAAARRFVVDEKAAADAYAAGTSQNANALAAAALLYGGNVGSHGVNATLWACDHWTPGSGCPIPNGWTA